jgi:hypothetical protein
VASLRESIIIDKYGKKSGISHQCLIAMKVMADTSNEVGVALQPDPRFEAGEIAIVPGYKAQIKTGIEKWKKLNNDNDDEAVPDFDQCV